jgi:alpha-tubulin suppressor-like RCC1 family protein
LGATEPSSIDPWGVCRRAVGTGLRRGGALLLAVVALAAGPVGTAMAAPGTTISTGGDFACQVVSGGEVECWGDNFLGELGNGLTAEDFSPTRYHVVGLTGAVALTTAGQDVEGHTCALINNGTVRCWGTNYDGTLGDGTTTYRRTPVAVTGLIEATEVGAGQFHSCALIAGGTVKCWGSNLYGQLGDGTSNDSLTPVTVSGLTDVTQLGVGFDSTCAVRESGELDCWGDNGWGTIGIGASTSDVPVAVPGVTAAIQVSVGVFHSCALLSNGQVMCWGVDNEGQLGDGEYKFIEETPAAVPGLTDAVQVAVGHDHSCALLAGGTVECWGSDAEGQLGVASLAKSAVPMPVPGLGDVVEIAASREATCALLSSGEAVCWGGEFGRLPTSTAPPGGGGSGGGTATDSGSPTTGTARGTTTGPPVVRITSHPPEETADQTAEFAFTGTAGGSYECSVDGGAWKPCRSGDSFAPLQPGDHRFEVRESLRGITGPAASYSWTIDLPKACILKVARARVFAFTHQDKARLVIRYKAYEPAQVGVSYSLAGAKGSLALGTASAPFKTAGVFRLGEKFGKPAAAKLRATSSMKVRFSIPEAPSSCSRYYTKRLTIPKKVFGQTVWFQSDSIFGQEAK